MAGVPTLGRAGALGRFWPRGGADGRAWPCVAAVAAPVAVLAVLLLAMGREPWCTCGHVKLWHGVVRSPGNSQHLTDWYTFAHVLDGFGFHLALRLLGRAWPPPLRLRWATTLAAAWEVVENSDFVIDHFRAATLALGYRGDSIVNSVGVVLACVLGRSVPGPDGRAAGGAGRPLARWAGRRRAEPRACARRSGGCHAARGPVPRLPRSVAQPRRGRRLPGHPVHQEAERAARHGTGPARQRRSGQQEAGGQGPGPKIIADRGRRSWRVSC
jgi:hypothetical protein